MFNTIAVKSAAFALLLVGAVAGAADAQAVVTPDPTLPPDAKYRCNCAGGLFTLGDATAARFYVALDDNPGQPDIFVTMRFIDRNGNDVKRKSAIIHPGGSAMLELPGPSGLYRMQADVYDPSTKLPFSPRRTITGAGETLARMTDGVILIGPPHWVPCDKKAAVIGQ